MTEDKHLEILIAGCRRMDEQCQMALYRHYYSYAMSIGLRYTQSRESALEMLNDGFLKVFQKIEQYDSDFPFKPWLRKILMNAAIDHYRKYKRTKPEALSISEKDTVAHNEALDHLEFEDLLEIMKDLPPAYNLVFNLYVVEGLPHAEIAEKLDITIGTSKSNLSKARQKIKEMLRSSHGIHF